MRDSLDARYTVASIRGGDLWDRGLTYGTKSCSGLDTPRYPCMISTKQVKKKKKHEPDSWEVADDFDVELFQELRVTDTRALKDLRCSESTTAEDNVLPRSDLSR